MLLRVNIPFSIFVVKAIIDGLNETQTLLEHVLEVILYFLAKLQQVVNILFRISTDARANYECNLEV